MSLIDTPRSEHPWVLVEGYGRRAQALAMTTRALGYEVYVCPGPDQSHPCPLLEGDRCQLIEAAEAVVNALGDKDADGAIAAATTASTDAPLLRVDSSTDVAEIGVAGQADATSTKHLARALRAAFELAIRESHLHDVEGSVGPSRAVRPVRIVGKGRPAPSHVELLEGARHLVQLALEGNRQVLDARLHEFRRALVAHLEAIAPDVGSLVAPVAGVVAAGHEQLIARADMLVATTASENSDSTKEVFHLAADLIRQVRLESSVCLDGTKRRRHGSRSK